MSSCDQTLIPAESDITGPRRWLQRRLVRLLLAVTCVTTLLCAGGAWWWTSRPDFGDVVREAGGRYRRDVMESRMSMLGNIINGRPNTVFHFIEFAPGRIDDDWLRHHQTEIRELTDLSLAFHGTRVTDRGLSHLHGAENVHSLSLRGTRLNDAAMSQIVQLPRLQLLDIADTGLSATAIADLAQMPFLAQVSIDSTQATPEGVAGLVACPELSSVMLVDADDGSVERITQLSGVVDLTLVAGDVTAASFPALERMQNLQLLTLYDLNLSDDEIQELQQALPDCIVQQPQPEVVEQIMESLWEEAE
jgi:hypothetical protein